PLQQKYRAAIPAEPSADEIQRSVTALSRKPVLLIRQIEELHWQCPDQRWNPESEYRGDDGDAHEKRKKRLLRLPAVWIAPLAEMRRNDIGQLRVIARKVNRGTDDQQDKQNLGQLGVHQNLFFTG